jgi:hypothetical protein
MFKRFPVVVAVALALVSSLVLAADAPETIEFDVIEGKRKVSFNHTKHSAEYKKAGGAEIVCKDCHHTLKSDNGEGEEVKKCTECHMKVGEEPKVFNDKPAPVLAVEKKPGKIDKKSVLFHKNCVEGCHKAMKAEGKKITACKTCHPKK